MRGKKPSKVETKKPSHIIVRSFRGSMLYLASVHGNKGMRWINDKKQARRLELDEARAIAKRASREWGTVATITDNDGNVYKPAQSALPERAMRCCLCNGVIGGSASYVSIGWKPAHATCAADSVSGLPVQS
jgi:hypothetical protein